MLLSVCSPHKNRVNPCPDSEHNSLIPAKRRKMQVSTAANGGPCIKIEQLVKHDVWNISRKDDGVFVMKKLTENDANAIASTSTANTNAGAVTNTEQTGARRKVTVQVPTPNNAVTINATNRSQNVNCVLTDNAIAAGSVNPPSTRVNVPEKKFITLMPTNTQNRVITISTTPVRPREVITVNTVAPDRGIPDVSAAPDRGIPSVSAASSLSGQAVNLNTAPSPKNKVITINATPSPKKEVITINTKPLIRPAVFTINTTNTKKSEDPGASQANINMKTQTFYNIRNVPKEGNASCFASTSKNESLASESKPNSGAQSQDTPIYSQEVYQIQEMFPQVPLNVISDNLKAQGSVESTIDSLLAQAAVEPEPSSEMPYTVPDDSDDDDIVFIKSVKSDKPKTENSSGDKASSDKKPGSVITIELLAKNEVWDIKRKDKEGFVLKKLTDDSKTEPLSSIRDNSALCADDSVQAVERGDPLLDIFMDDLSCIRNPEQSNAPVKMVVYSPQLSKKTSLASEREILAPGKDNFDLTAEADDFIDSSSSPEQKVSVEEFDFSDDENEDRETVEHFLFKASLVLRKLKFRCDSKIKEPEDLALLKITGGTQNKETDRAVTVEEEVSSNGSDEEWYTDEGE